jgi:ferredoxin-NADP reductase
MVELPEIQMRFELLLPTPLRVAALQMANAVSTLRGVATAPPSPIFLKRHSEEELREFSRRAGEQRREQAAATRSRGAHEWTLEVVESRRENDDTTTIVFARPNDDRMTFTAGQFMTFFVASNGEELRRSYSISSPPNDKERLSITVKRIDGGRASTALQDVVVGQKFRAIGPGGRFGIAATTATRRIVLIGAGSGITPLWSIASEMAVTRPELEISMVCGARTTADRIFGREIDALAKTNARVTARWALSREKKRGVTHGRIGADNLAKLAAIDTDSEYFVCGPEGLIDTVRSTLTAAGVAGSQIHVEHFTLRTFASRGTGRRWSVSFTRAGRLIEAGEDETILEAALDAGVSLPSSCAMGGCAVCRCRLVEGEVEMDEPNCLTQEERDRGDILACVARATGPVVIDA